MSDLELSEIPSERSYRGEIDREELEGMETILGMRNANNFRWKLKVLARECRNPEKGRTISANCWVRLDEYGNPEIIDESKGTHWDSPTKFVAARFCVDGIRIQCHEPVAFSRYGSISYVYDAMTDYSINLRAQEAYPTTVDWDAMGIQDEHPSLWGWYGHDDDGCVICDKFRETLTELSAAIEQQKTERKEIMDSYTIHSESDESEYGTIFVPYSTNDANLSPEAQTYKNYWSSREYSDFIGAVNKHLAKIKTKRGAPKDVF